MIMTHAMLIEQLSHFSAPNNKLMRMVKSGEITPVIRGLYETDPSISPYLLAGSICGPSYVSFEYALSFFGMIPERVETITCASFEKRKKKQFETPFGKFSYRDVPSAAFPLFLQIKEEDGRYFRIASPEKALCDQLYKEKPLTSAKALRTFLREDMRIDIEDLRTLDVHTVDVLAAAYKCTNVRWLLAVMQKGM